MKSDLGHRVALSNSDMHMSLEIMYAIVDFYQRDRPHSLSQAIHLAMVNKTWFRVVMDHYWRQLTIVVDQRGLVQLHHLIHALSTPSTVILHTYPSSLGVIRFIDIHLDDMCYFPHLLPLLDPFPHVRNIAIVTSASIISPLILIEVTQVLEKFMLLERIRVEFAECQPLAAIVGLPTTLVTNLREMPLRVLDFSCPSGWLVNDYEPSVLYAMPRLRVLKLSYLFLGQLCILDYIVLAQLDELRAVVLEDVCLQVYTTLHALNAASMQLDQSLRSLVRTCTRLETLVCRLRPSDRKELTPKLDVWVFMTTLSELYHLQHVSMDLDLLRHSGSPPNVLTFPSLQYVEITSYLGYMDAHTYHGLCSFNWPSLGELNVKIPSKGLVVREACKLLDTAPRLSKWTLEFDDDKDDLAQVVHHVCQRIRPCLTVVDLACFYTRHTSGRSKAHDTVWPLVKACPYAYIHIRAQGTCRLYYGAKVRLHGQWEAPFKRGGQCEDYRDHLH
jgi:hypothetical protein